MNLEEIKQQVIESTEKKISRGREMIADTKLDIETKKKEIKELEQDIVKYQTFIEFREKAINKLKEIN
jgi:peptidoglycan hydrolase CwlO-like protein